MSTKMKEQQRMPLETTRWVYDVLAPDQLSTVKRRQHLGKQHLKPAILAILWALRVYVVLMLCLIGYQIWTVLHP